MKKILLLLVIATLLMTCLWSANRVIVRYDNPSTQLFHRFLTEKADIAAYHPGMFLDIVVPQEQVTQLQNEYPSLRVIQTEEQSQANLHSQERDIPGYRSYDTMLTELQAIAAAHPNICRLYNLGETLGKQYFDAGNNQYQPYQFNIWAMKVSDNPDVEEDEPGVYYLGPHHAREPLAVEVTMEILHELVDNYGTDTEMTDRVNNMQVWFVPLVNPDGHEVVWSGLDIWWRKNIRDNNINGVFDSYYQYGYGEDGVDLNRNYGTYWGALGATDDLFSPIYHGISAFSEPETVIIKNLLDSHHFVAGISYHTYAGLVLYPTGYYVGANAPDFDALQALAQEMAATIPDYTAESEAELYPAMGGTDDYSYAEQGTFAFTIELGINEFIPPSEEMNEIVDQNMDAAFILMDRVKTLCITGIVTDSLTNQPLVATITVPGVDNQGAYRKPYQSDAQYGRYYRLLVPNYPVIKYSAYGYKTKTQENILLDFDAQTIIDCQLVPALPASLSGRVTSGTTLEAISGATVKFPGTPIGDTVTDANGYFTITNTYEGTYTIEIYKEGYDWLCVPVTLNVGDNHIEWQILLPTINVTFESPLQWITTGSWVTTTVQHVSGSHCLTDSQGDYSEVPESTIAQYPVAIDLQDTPNVSVSFMVKTDLLQNYDYVNFEASRNGTDWLTIDSYYNSSNWTPKTYNLNQFIPGNLYLRFHMVTTGYGIADGIYIDDFKVFLNSLIVPAITITQPALKLSLQQNNPNPFNPETAISYTIPMSANISLNIFNIKGQKVRTLVSEKQERGNHSIRWDGKDALGNNAASGVYFYRLDAEGQPSQTRKMLLLK